MRARPLRVNFVYNLLGPLARLVVAVITIPIYIRHIGDARYGVISIVWVLLGYFGFLDLGLSRAATNALAKLRDAPQHERARVFLTTIALNAVLGLAGAAVLFVFGKFLLMHFLSVSDKLKPEVGESFPWIACLLPLTLILGVAIGALESSERFLLANVLQTTGSTISLVSPLVAAILIGPSLPVVIGATAAAQAANVFFALAVVHRFEGPFDVSAFDRRAARGLLSYGGWISVSNVVAPLLTSADQLLIGSAIGAAAVAHYAVPMSLVSRSSIIPVALVRAFFPRMSSLPAEDARSLASRAFAPLAYAYAALCAPAIIAAHTVLRYWISADFAEAAAPVGEVLFVGAWINGLGLVAITLLQGQGRVAAVARIHVVEVAPFLAVLWWLTTAFGIVGAAIAWSLRCAADAFALFWVAGLSRRDMLSLLGPTLLLGVSVVIARPVSSNPDVATAVALTAGLLVLVAGWIGCEECRREYELIVSLARANYRVLRLVNFARRDRIHKS